LFGGTSASFPFRELLAAIQQRHGFTLDLTSHLVEIGESIRVN
jgi:hypothetical protein